MEAVPASQKENRPRMAIMEMIEQKRYIDDDEGTGINEFLDDIIEKHKLREFYPNIEIRWRDVCRRIESTPTATDDKIVQLVVENRLVALVFSRRDEFNHTEVNYFFNEEALEKCKKFKERVERKITESPEN